MKCNDCKGEGKIELFSSWEDPCQTCKGSGVLEEEKTLWEQIVERDKANCSNDKETKVITVVTNKMMSISPEMDKTLRDILKRDKPQKRKRKGGGAVINPSLLKKFPNGPFRD